MADGPVAATPGESITLLDGRRLGYAQFGDPGGTPVFFFHGAADSRLQRHADDSIAESLGVRLITVDRPGVGLSDFQRRRKLLDWADDTAALANSLALEYFAVLGYSMGGPHALACAYRLPGRVTMAGVVSGIAPFDRPGATVNLSPFVARMFACARVSARAVQLPIWLMGRNASRDPGALLDSMFRDASAYDRAVYMEPGRRDNQIAALREASRQGMRGLSWELAVVARPWGFNLAEIETPVLLFYGGEDRTAPPQMGEYLASRIPRSTLTIWPDAGHQAIFVHWREVLAALTGTA